MWYLRALGAKVGPGTVIFSRNVPVCTDLLTIGADTVIRKESFFGCYRAHAGWIQTGTVTIGRNAFIGEKTVLDINTSMGDVSQLGHASSLHSGQRVPAGERWHGSPAQRTDLNYLRVSPERCGTFRRFRFSAATLFCVFFLYLPLVEGGVFLLLTAVPMLGQVLDPHGWRRSPRRRSTSTRSYVSLVLFFGCGAPRPARRGHVPRLLNLFIKPCVVYPLFGFHDRIHRAIMRMTSVRFFTHLFGDSSFIVYYLRWLGYDLCEVEQTGSNFGTGGGARDPVPEHDRQRDDGRRRPVDHERRLLDHVLPALSGVYRGQQLLREQHRLSGWRPDGRQLPDRDEGDDPARRGDPRGVGLLGSPSFEIPRSVERDSRFDYLSEGDELRRRLRAKNWHNLRTMGIFLLGRWLHVFLVTVFALAAFDSYGGFAQLQMAVLFALSVLVTPVYFVLLERGIRGWRRLEPKYCSIYDPYFWRHERLWKVPGERYLHMFDGTPFKNLIWRGLGVRIGKRVFDDGCYLTERTLTTIGDDVMLNAGNEDPVPLAGGRHVQVRPDHDRQTAAPSGSARWSTTA